MPEGFNVKKYLDTHMTVSPWYRESIVVGCHGVRMARRRVRPPSRRRRLLAYALRLSFADAVRLASGEVRWWRADVRTNEADARVREARAALLPSLSVSGAC